jgi:hypothetical protein
MNHQRMEILKAALTPETEQILGPREQPIGQQLLDRDDGQVRNAALFVLVAGDGHFIFHLTDDIRREGAIVLGRQEDVHLVGALFDQRHRDAFFRTRSGARLMARAVRAERDIAEAVFERSSDGHLCRHCGRKDAGGKSDSTHRKEFFHGFLRFQE